MDEARTPRASTRRPWSTKAAGVRAGDGTPALFANRERSSGTDDVR